MSRRVTLIVELDVENSVPDDDIVGVTDIHFLDAGSVVNVELFTDNPGKTIQ